MGSWKVPGQVPGQCSGTGFRAGSGQGFSEVPGRVLEGTVPERIENDLVADLGTGFRDGSLGEPVAVAAVALVPALVRVVVVTDERCNPVRT